MQQLGKHVADMKAICIYYLYINMHTLCMHVCVVCGCVFVCVGVGVWVWVCVHVCVSNPQNVGNRLLYHHSLLPAWRASAVCFHKLLCELFNHTQSGEYPVFLFFFCGFPIRCHTHIHMYHLQYFLWPGVVHVHVVWTTCACSYCTLMMKIWYEKGLHQEGTKQHHTV